MVKKPKLYDKSYADELFSIAEGDLSSAHILANAESGRPENAIYMAQQAVEKGLKALLCRYGIPLRHTHDIESLIVQLDGKIDVPNSENLIGLTEFASIRRYLEGKEKLEKEDLLEAVKLAEEFLKWAKLVKIE